MLERITTLKDISQIKIPKSGSTSNLTKGDILLPRIKSVKNTKFTKSATRASKLSAYWIVKPNSKEIIPGYLFAVLSSKKIRTKLNQAAKGKVIQFIPLKNIANLKISILTLSKQKSISEKFFGLYNTMEKSKEKYEKAKKNFLWDVMNARRSHAESVLIPSILNWERFLNVIPRSERKSILTQLEKKEKTVLKLEKEYQKDKKQMEKFKT